MRRSTAKDRFRRALKRVADWCRMHRHDDLREQQQALAQKLRGHFGYYGIKASDVLKMRLASRQQVEAGSK